MERPGLGKFGNRGVSLLETVIALFILLGVLTFTLELYSRSLQSQAKVEKNERAAFFADNVLSQLRHWARDSANFRSDPWTRFTNYTEPEFPGFSAQVRTRWAPVLTPCTSQESPRPADRQRWLRETVKTATAEIFYEGEPLFEVTTLVNEPKRVPATTDPVVVEAVGGAPAQLDPDAEQRYTAKLVDDSGREIEDVMFSWSVQPLSGNAFIAQSARDGSWGELVNAYPIPPAQRVYTGGACQAIATVRYAGVEYRGLSPQIGLLKP